MLLGLVNSDIVIETTGSKIRIQRLTKNYSQVYMAFMLGISQAAYSKLERDETKISLNRVFAIAEILEITPFILMPQPKYGFGINQEFIWRLIHKLKQFCTGGFNKKKGEAATFKYVNSMNNDITNIEIE